jgi:hypothetical protein
LSQGWLFFSCLEFAWRWRNRQQEAWSGRISAIDAIDDNAQHFGGQLTQGMDRIGQCILAHLICANHQQGALA